MDRAVCLPLQNPNSTQGGDRLLCPTRRGLPTLSRANREGTDFSVPKGVRALGSQKSSGPSGQSCLSPSRSVISRRARAISRVAGIHHRIATIKIPMALRFYNTLTQQVENFSTLHDHVVRMYTCGRPSITTSTSATSGPSRFRTSCDAGYATAATRSITS